MPEFINNILKARSVYFAWFAATLFYCYQYILRVLPGVMHRDIRTEFALQAEDFVTLGSLYLLAYSILQIPLGIITDKLGVRRIILSSIVLCILGSLLFYVGENFLLLQIARFIMGVGSAAAFMCALKIVADNMPAWHRGFLLGLTLAFGTLGVLFSANVISYMLEVFSWREVWYKAAILGVVVFIIAWFGFKKEITNGSSTTAGQFYFSIPPIIGEVVNTVKNPLIMLYALIAVGLYAPLSVLADLMGVAFIEQKFCVSNVIGAKTAMMLYLGLAAGSILIPWVCEKFNVLTGGIKVSTLGILIAFSLLLYMPDISINFAIILLVVIGILCGSEMLCFTAALKISHSNNSGIIIGVINTMNMLGGAVLEQMVGWLLDLQWDSIYDMNQIRIYSVQHYTVSFSFLVGVIALCTALTFFLKRN